ncbi:MAG: DUF4422 domain-containing protein [Huintestinicola sp.]
MSNIKIFVIGHKEFPVPEFDMLVPVQAGASLAEHGIDGWLRDDEGDNISDLNRSYCELTAHYFAWKNIDADYYGFFHYRRYFSFDEGSKNRPYKILRTPDSAFLSGNGYNDKLSSLIERFDIIAPIPEEMFESVYDYYKNSPHQRIGDLELAVSILKEKYPEYSKYADEYLSGTKNYFCNMYIMKKELFHCYCGWLFDILNEFDKRKDTTGYSQQELRVDGFIAERLFGIYFTKLKADNISFLEVPRVDFISDRKAYLKKRLMYTLVPPESIRKKTVKKLMHRS